MRGRLVGLWLAALASLAAAKIGYFWHITDIHYDVNYSVKGDVRKNCWRTENGGGGGSRRPGRYGDYSCDSPWALVESAAHAMRAKSGDNIEFVLWTGDGLASTANGRSTDMQVTALQNLTNLLSKTFPSQFVFPVLGHDDPGTTPGQRLGYKEIGQYWHLWLPTDAITTFNKGGYYTIEQKENKLRIVALNTNLYSGQWAEDDPLGQWAWLEDTLKKSQRQRESVYIVGHMAPGADERQPDAAPLFREKHSRTFLRLVRRYSEIIVGQFFGHLHSDTFRVIYDEQGKPVNWILAAPAVSPRRTAGGPNNPALRLYKFETTSGKVLDYTQFYLPLSNANQAERAEWQLEYNITSYYGLETVSALSLHELAETFTNTDPSGRYFNRYFQANSVGLYSSAEDGRCDLNCAHTHYCAISRLEYSEFRHCLEAAASALASSRGPAPRATPASLGLAATLLLLLSRSAIAST